MKRLTASAVIGFSLALAAHAAEERFSQTVRPEDFSAAGLAKLSPAELERLDALVRDFKGRAVEAARSPMPSTPVAAITAGDSAAKPASVAAAPKKSEGGLLARAKKVILAPGTEIEYSTVESRIVGEFRGWQSRTTFTLENGQRWQVDGTDAYVGPPIQNPAVKISPGVLGVFWMNIDGVKRRVKVKLISSP